MQQPAAFRVTPFSWRRYWEYVSAGASLHSSERLSFVALLESCPRTCHSHDFLVQILHGHEQRIFLFMPCRHHQSILVRVRSQVP